MSTALGELCKDLSIKFTGHAASEEEVKNILKNTVFKGKEATKYNEAVEVTDSQLTALLIICKQYGLNPFTKEIYAYPDKGGIVPLVGVDGWSRIINSHGQLDSIEFEYSEKLIQLEGMAYEAPEWVECIIYRKDRSRPTKIREYLVEIYRKPFVGKKKKPDGSYEEYQVNGPWQTNTIRQMRHKGLIQCSRITFGFVGIFDEDEGDRIKEAKWQQSEVLEEKISFDPTDGLLIQVESTENLKDLQEIWKTGSKQLAESQIDNQKFKESVTKKKKELSTLANNATVQERGN